MRLTLTADAAEQLRRKQGERAGSLRLIFDTEGCGCAVNGVPTLWITDAPAAGDTLIAEEPLQVWIEPQHTIYFEDEVKLDYRDASRSFRLQSDSQIYNSLMPVLDRRAESVRGSVGAGMMITEGLACL